MPSVTTSHARLVLSEEPLWLVVQGAGQDQTFRFEPDASKVVVVSPSITEAEYFETPIEFVPSHFTGRLSPARLEKVKQVAAELRETDPVLVELKRRLLVKARGLGMAQNTTASGQHQRSRAQSLSKQLPIMIDR